MNCRFIAILVFLSACASTVYKNDQETPPTRYTDQLIDYDPLTDEVIITLKKYISERLAELVDHSINATNENYAEPLRSYSKERVSKIMNVSTGKKSNEKVDDIIEKVRKSSFEEFIIGSPKFDEDSILSSNISLKGKDFIKARIKTKLRLFATDTLEVWEVDFWYLGKDNLDWSRNGK